MAEGEEVSRMLDLCEQYWRETGVPRQAVVEMRLELERHLMDAIADGRSAESVVGADTAAFAEAWASEYREGTPRVTWDEVARGARRDALRARRELAAYGAGVATLVVATAVVAGQGGDGVDMNIWRWLWTGFAIVMGVGEIFTAGFFLLPFAIGAGAAAVLAWLDVNVLAQWLVFFGVSIISFAYLRRFIRRQDEMGQPSVGANRWLNARGVVLEDIDPTFAKGMVRVEGEEWRATTDGPPLPAGTRIVVNAVRGARLVVSSDDDTRKE